MITNERADDTRKGPGACQAKISLFGAALLNSGLRASHLMAGLLAKMRLDCQSMTRNSFIWRMLIAEYVGTMLLVLVGCAATVSGWNEDHSISLVGVALTFGILIAGLIVIIGPISGCHINPAVSLSMAAAGKISVVRAFAFTIVQCVGAICGAALLQALTPVRLHNSLGATVVHPDLTPPQAFGIEFFGTFLLVLVIFAFSNENQTEAFAQAPLIIGLTVSAIVCSMAKYTGASLNPARSLGPAVITGEWALHWVYWAGPLVGGVTAAVLYQKVFRQRPPPAEPYPVEYETEASKAIEIEAI